MITVQRHNFKALVTHSLTPHYYMIHSTLTAFYLPSHNPLSYCRALLKLTKLKFLPSQRFDKHALTTMSPMHDVNIFPSRFMLEVPFASGTSR